MMRSRLVVALILVAMAVPDLAFVIRSSTFVGRSVTSSSSTASAPLHARKDNDETPSFLLEEFKTATGEVLDPYKVLKIKRTATRQEIKQSYRDMSRRYHPDGMRHRDILPGSCNNLDDVRDHWERIKLSYEILSDNKQRKRYDRHQVLADPAKAMQRAAVSAVGSGVASVGKSIFQMGAFAVTQLMNTAPKA